MKPTHTYIAIVMLVAAFLILGCAGAKPFDYHSGNEIPEGPGLFSKEKGAFTIYSSEKDAKASAEKQAGQDTFAPGTDQTENVPVDSKEEFRQFKKWRNEQKAFEAFQQWKQSPQNAGEDEEFQEWKRWQEFRQWQETQPKGQ